MNPPSMAQNAGQSGNNSHCKSWPYFSMNVLPVFGAVGYQWGGKRRHLLMPCSIVCGEVGDDMSFDSQVEYPNGPDIHMSLGLMTIRDMIQ